MNESYGYNNGSYQSINQSINLCIHRTRWRYYLMGIYGGEKEWTEGVSSWREKKTEKMVNEREKKKMQMVRRPITTNQKAK